MTEMDDEAKLGRGASVTTPDQLDVVVGQGEARQSAVIEGGREVGELGALGKPSPATKARWVPNGWCGALSRQLAWVATASGLSLKVGKNR